MEDYEPDYMDVYDAYSKDKDREERRNLNKEEMRAIKRCLSSRHIRMFEIARVNQIMRMDIHSH